MKLLVGLGNPGAKYLGTRHNIGFEVVSQVVSALGPVAWRREFRGLTCRIQLGAAPVICLKPETFMNDSGSSVAMAANYHGFAATDVLVVHDELDLGFGTLRLKQGGGDGGHRGLRSLIAHLGPEFVRLRFGIGRPPLEFGGAVADFVLEAFAPDERAKLDESLERAARVVLDVARDGLSLAMNSTNRRTE